MVALIGMSIFLLAEVLYEYEAVARSTNWHIFYFVSMYFAWLLISVDVIYRENSKSMQGTSLGFVVLFICLIISELRFINVPFDKYIIGVNDNKVQMLFIGILAIILIFVSITAWERRYSKTY